MNIIIHRGAHEIGGNCVEIATERTRLIFDIGIPLAAMDEHLPATHYEIAGVRGLYQSDKSADNPETAEKAVDAVFITHAHGDHYGLLLSVRKEIPVYTTPLAKELICENASRLDRQPYYKKEITPLQHIPSTHDWQPVTIGDITVYPHTVDHSAADAVAFTIIAGDEVIFYSGDLRFHGKKARFMRELQTLLSKSSVDTMILEGTNLRSEEKPVPYPTEQSVYKALLSEFSADKRLHLVCFSSQNADRFCSVYKACLRSGRTLVIDPYTARCLQAFHAHHPNIPSYWAKQIAIYDNGSRLSKTYLATATGRKYAEKAITLEAIYAHPERYVVKANYLTQKRVLSHCGAENVNIIYSAWEGYLKKDTELSPLHAQGKVKLIHCSGHAYKKDLQAFVAAVKPKQLIPIHTEHAEQMGEIMGKM